MEQDDGLLQWNESIVNKIIYIGNSETTVSSCLRNFGEIKTKVWQRLLLQLT